MKVSGVSTLLNKYLAEGHFVPPEQNNFPIIFLFLRVVYGAQSHEVMGVQEAVFGDYRDRIPYAELLALSDEQLIEELQTGNADAFAVVFKRYHRLVHLVALRVLRDAGEAEDLTQAVFLEIYEKVGQFDPARGTLRVWLLQHAHSRTINRRNYLLVRQFHNHVELNAVEEEHWLWSPRHLAMQEAVHLTGEALAALPDAQRQTIQMFFFDGLTFKDIAKRRNETLANVRHHYYRGLDRLRSFFEPEVQTETPKGSVLRLGEIRRVQT